MLIGRGAETARIERALAEGRLGVSSAIVISGDAGIGKTALLEHAFEQAAGMRVLRARGVQFESDVPFAGLHDLLRPALDEIDALPQEGAGALRSALGIGQRLEGDRLLIGAAVLQLLVHLAATPLLVAIDDAHWLDRASSETLAFAIRRLLADPVTVLVAIREGQSSPFLQAGIPELRLGGLDPHAAGALVRSLASVTLDGEVVQRILSATAGNPLALRELAGEAHRFAGGPVDAPLPVATSVERAYLRRVQGMSEQARTALLVLAASGTAGIAQVRRAALRLGSSAAAVEEVESASPLVDVRDGRLEFVHPLARAAVYHAASPADRRAAHRALAEVMAVDDADRRAWHLAAASDGVDEAAATELMAAGRRAQLRTGYAEAAAAFDYAARVSGAGPERAERLLAAAGAAWLSGQVEWGLQLLEAARAGASAATAVEADALAGQIALRRGEVEAGFVLVRRAADQLAGTERPRAIQLLADATLMGFGAGRTADMLLTGRRALELLGDGDDESARVEAHTAYGAAAVMAALGDEGPRHLLIAAAGIDAGSRLTDPLLMACAGNVGLFLREPETGRDLLDRALAGAREHAPAAALPVVLFYLARHAATTDQWSAARAHYEESARLARETNQVTWLTGALAGLAHLDALEGRPAELQAHADEAEALAVEYGLGNFLGWVLGARALLEAGTGRPAAARHHLDRLRGLLAELGIEDPDIDPSPDLVEIALRLGETDNARDEARAYARRAAAKGQPFALARAERGLGLVADDDSFRARFDAALSHHRATPDTFEQARTQLAYGERLRRSRQRRAARAQLADAAASFERLGAPQWAARTMTELAATGATTTAGDPRARHRLTAQELQVALALAEGDTTRQAAAKLFISPKTVEYHLRNVYDKLEVRSRDDLRTALSGSLEPG